MKRSFDVFFSLVALTVFCIPMAVISLLIVADRGPVLYRQSRLGKGKVPFTILKFRTLDNDQPTRIGAVLRRIGLDELPQFFNVLAGSMSIVGPRALTATDIQRLGWDADYYRNRWNVKPGITGIAQLYGGQHRKKSWFWDQYYLQRANAFTDVIIVALSFLVNLFGKTRVRRILFRNKKLK